MLPVPYAVRLNHKPRHGASLRRRPFAYLHSMLREAGEFFFGAFAPMSA